MPCWPKLATFHIRDRVPPGIRSLFSSYHLEINPEGVLVEGNPGPNWKSLAEVTTERGSDSWRVRLRIPVVDEAEARSDPRHRVAGHKPTVQAPWYFNVGRLRVSTSRGPSFRRFPHEVRVACPGKVREAPVRKYVKKWKIGPGTSSDLGALPRRFPEPEDNVLQAGGRL